MLETTQPPDERDLPRDRFIDIKGILMAEVAATTVEVLPGSLPEPTRGRGTRIRRRAIIAVPVMATLLAIALVLHTSGTPAAASALRAAAAAIQKQPWTPLQEGEYWYQETRSFGSFGADYHHQFYEVLAPYAHETWISLEGTGRLVETFDPDLTLTFPTDRDRELWIAAGRPSLGIGINDTQRFSPAEGAGLLPFGDGGLSIGEAMNLPQTDGHLFPMLDQAAGGSDPSPSRRWTVFTDLIGASAPLPPGLIAALYRYAATIPGVSYLGTVSDPLGRRVEAVAFDEGANREEVLFDAASGSYRGSMNVVLDPPSDSNLDPGDVVNYRLVLQAGVTGSAEARPNPH